MGTDAYDVIVIGGGTAGVIAAVQSGRAGAKTLLVEKSGVLGGTITNGGIGFVSAFHAWGEQLIAGIGWELVRRCLAERGDDPPAHPEPVDDSYIKGVHIDPVLYAALADEMVTEAGVDLLLHTMIAGAVGNEDGWTVTLCTKSGLREEKAIVVVDCTGDANAAALAGFEIIRPETVQPCTQVFRLTGYDADALDYGALQKAFDAAVDSGEVKPTDITWNMTKVSIEQYLRSGGGNCGHICGINAGDSEGRTAAELAGRRAFMRLFRFLRKQPGLEGVRVSRFAAECGVRETAVIRGETTVTVEEYTAGHVYPDAVCHSFYPVDLHIDDGSGVNWRRPAKGVRPTIPRGAMLPAGSRNFVAAGRCISSDRLANSALRVEASCMAMGQAGGAMAALAARTGTAVCELPMETIRDLLREHGAVVPRTPGEAVP